MEPRYVGAMMKRIADRLKVYADGILKEYGITFSQAMAIWYIIENGGEVTQKELEKHLQVAHPTVVGIVSRLCKKGFVESYIDEGNHGRKMICLTDKAKAMEEDAKSRQFEVESWIVRDFKEQEVEQFLAYLERVYQNLSE